MERFDLNMLAMYCLRVAESAETDPRKAEQARQLKAEWALFIGHTKPPIPGLDTPEAIAAYGHELRHRMVNFLAGCPLTFTLAGEGATPAGSQFRRATVGGRD